MIKTRYRVLSIDPGITNTGWAILDYNTKTSGITTSAYGHFDRAYLVKKRKTMQESDMHKRYAAHYVLLDAYYYVICDLIKRYGPDEIVCEGAFAHKFIQAYMSLILVIHTIRRASHMCIDKDVHIVAPQEAKLWITNSGGATKTETTTAILGYENLTIRSNKQRSIENAPNHVFDAIAIGVTFIQKSLTVMLSAENHNIQGTEET